MNSLGPRRFLRGIVGGDGATALAASGIPAASSPGRGVAEPSGTLVIITLVGGLDGLSLLVPYGDPAYAARRPGLAVGPPGERYGAIEFGRGLGLHPSLAPLYDAVGRSDRLAVIGGVGIPDAHGGDRNHLPCREFLHRGGRGQVDGWATRLLRFEGMGPEAVWSFGTGPHAMFDGMPGQVVAPAPSAVVSVGVHDTVVERHRLQVDDPAIVPAGSARWSDVEWTSPADRLARGYPEGRLGRSLASTADMIRDDTNPTRRSLRLVAIDHSGYDTHVDQGDGRSGVLTHRLDRLSRALAAFWSDVTTARPDGTRDGAPVTVVVVSEFGRAIDENGSGGTEHGRGGVALALGDQVVGGVHGDLPSLARDEVWPVTVDVRRVLADAVAGHGFRPWTSEIFPRLSLPNRSLGLLLSP